MANHSVRRTSPKETPFRGTCVLCGEENLTWINMNDECANVRNLTQDDALIEAIKGTKQ